MQLKSEDVDLVRAVQRVVLQDKELKAMASQLKEMQTTISSLTREQIETLASLEQAARKHAEENAAREEMTSRLEQAQRERAEADAALKEMTSGLEQTEREHAETDAALKEMASRLELVERERAEADAALKEMSSRLEQDGDLEWPASDGGDVLSETPSEISFGNLPPDSAHDQERGLKGKCVSVASSLAGSSVEQLEKEELLVPTLKSDMAEEYQQEHANRAATHLQKTMRGKAITDALKPVNMRAARKNSAPAARASYLCEKRDKPGVAPTRERGDGGLLLSSVACDSPQLPITTEGDQAPIIATSSHATPPRTVEETWHEPAPQQSEAERSMLITHDPEEARTLVAWQVQRALTRLK